PDIHIKLANESSTRPKCFYNDRYQYLFNQYFIRTINYDVCLLHYIDSSTISDVSQNSFKNGSIFYSYPGDGFYPIDFSYTFLKNDTCSYVEVEIDESTITRSVDCFQRLFHTNKMPIKIFACSCNLQNNGNHCDRKLATEIADRAKRFPIKLLTKCSKFEAIGLEMKKSKLVYARHTSYCFVLIHPVFDEDSNITRFNITGDAVTRQMVDESEMHLNHIAFSMLNFAIEIIILLNNYIICMTGTDTKFCKTFWWYNLESTAGICFCRSYDFDALPCNQGPKMIAMTIKTFMENEGYYEKPYLTRHVFDLRGSLLCQWSSFYAAILVDPKTGNFYGHPKCVPNEFDLLKSERNHRPKSFGKCIIIIVSLKSFKYYDEIKSC
ncbi:hypothetical protein LOAG_06456, partial [Loa loa]